MLLRTDRFAIAFDLCQKNLRRAELKDIERLDVQGYTRTHWDHWHPPHAKAILHHTGAPILVEPAVLEERGAVPAADLALVRPGQPIAVGALTLRGLAGVHVRPITLFHVEGPSLSVFHGGNSGYVPLGKTATDVAFVPVGAPSPSCSPESALRMVRDLGAKVAVGLHGSIEELETFRELAGPELPETQVVIPKPCELVSLRLSG